REGTMPELDKKALAFEITADVTPTRSGLLGTPAYANYVRIVHDENGFTLYFFLVPAEVLEMPEVRTQLEHLKGESTSKKDSAATSGPLPGRISVQPEPV